MSSYIYSIMRVTPSAPAATHLSQAPKVSRLWKLMFFFSVASTKDTSIMLPVYLSAATVV